MIRNKDHLIKRLIRNNSQVKFYIGLFQNEDGSFFAVRYTDTEKLNTALNSFPGLSMQLGTGTMTKQEILVEIDFFHEHGEQTLHSSIHQAVN